MRDSNKGGQRPPGAAPFISTKHTDASSACLVLQATTNDVGASLKCADFINYVSLNFYLGLIRTSPREHNAVANCEADILDSRVCLDSVIEGDNRPCVIIIRRQYIAAPEDIIRNDQTAWTQQW